MIRTLSPDELSWFLAQAFTFLQHSDPKSFAARILPRLRDAELEADRMFILSEGEPLAGVYVIAPDIDDDDQNLTLSYAWYRHSAADLEKLLRHVFARHHYEALLFPLYNHSSQLIERVYPVFKSLGFRLETACELDFELAELPPLGLPLVLEAWSHATEVSFRELYEAAETPISDEYWAWLKRFRGRFDPDFWFITSETLDQPSIGYAFYGAKRRGLEGVYYLTAAGVLPMHRHSSEMLRRVLLSSLHDLASRSPFGRIETTLSMADPKLIQIFQSLGFDTFHKYQRFIKPPT